MEENKELKELLILNLKVNSFILSTLVNIKGFNFDSKSVLNLLNEINKVINKEKEKNEIVN